MMPIDLFKALGPVRDPVVVIVCALSVFILNKNYATKDDHNQLKKEIEKIAEGYVSKEKLTDKLEPIYDQLKSIGRELAEIKRLLVEKLRK